MKNLKRQLPGALVALGLSFALAGCGKNDVQVYKIAKDPSAAGAPAGMVPPAMSMGDAAAKPKLKWTLPAGWQEVPAGEMRAASFKVKGEGGKEADVSVIPLPGFAGGDLNNVNRWRGQVGLAPVTEDELAKLAEKVMAGGAETSLFDLAGAGASGDKTRILATVLHRDETAWFFKMTGDDAVVEQQKGGFKDFLKSLEFEVAAAQPGLPADHPPIGGAGLAIGQPGMGAAATGSIQTEGQPKWSVPGDWKEVPGGQFLVAKFSLTGDNGAAAAVNVSNSAGDGGGLVSNVNRWRGQLGLSPADGADLQKQVKEIDLVEGKATLIELSGKDVRTGNPAALVGAIVPRGGQTWFFKLMGDAKVVEAQKEAFTKFVQAVKY